MTEADLEPQQKNLWLKGVSAYQLKNFDYAVNLILTVVKQAPQFLEGRRLLRRGVPGMARRPGAHRACPSWRSATAP